MDEGGNALVFSLEKINGVRPHYEILNLQELYLKITKHHIIRFKILYNIGQILC